MCDVTLCVRVCACASTILRVHGFLAHRMLSEVTCDNYLLCRGRFCAVSQCKQKVTNAAFAAKKYHVANLVQEWSSQCNDTEEVWKVVRKRVEQELEILKSLHHPCFPAALEGYASSSAFVLVMEL